MGGKTSYNYTLSTSINLYNCNEARHALILKDALKKSVILRTLDKPKTHVL